MAPRYRPTYLTDGLLFTAAAAWAWYRLPTTSRQYEPVGAYEALARTIARALDTAAGDTGTLTLQLRAVRAPFDTEAWRQRLNTVSAPHGAAASRYQDYTARMADHIDDMGFTDTAIYLGIELPATHTDTSAKTTLRNLLNGVVGNSDRAPEPEVIRAANHTAGDLRDALAEHLEIEKATVPEIAWLIRKPYWNTRECPGITLPAGVSFDADAISTLVEETITVGERSLLIDGENPHHTTFLSVGTYPERSQWPQELSWYAIAASLEPDAEVTIHATITPVREVMKRLNKLKTTVHEEVDEAYEYNTSDAAEMAGRADDVAATIAHTKSRGIGWIDMTCRIQLRGETPEDLDSRRRRLQKALRDHGYTLHCPAHEQLALLQEAQPGGPWESDLHRISADLEALGATGALLDFRVGDDNRAGMYIGYTLDGEASPVLLDPNRAPMTNNPPGLLITGKPGYGKALALDTPIPTPLGWTTMGELSSGDLVFDENGKPCTVTYATPIQYDRECFEVEFDDGSVIVADAEHRWLTSTARDRKLQASATKQRKVSTPERIASIRAAIQNAGPDEHATVTQIAALLPHGPGRQTVASACRRQAEKGVTPGKCPVTKARTWPIRDVLADIEHTTSSFLGDTRAGSDLGASVKTTAEIRDTLLVEQGKRANHAISVAGPWETPEEDLPIDPYLMGVWLGHGHSKQPAFCGVDPFIAEEVRRRGYTVTERSDMRPAYRPDYRVYTVDGIAEILRDLGVMTPSGQSGTRKHIPDLYFRGSIEQRMDLLRGLMDTDGTITPQGSAEFRSTSKALAYGVRELAHSLGIKTFVGTKAVAGRTPATSTFYRVRFTTDLPVFLLPTKAQRISTQVRPTQRQRCIVAVRPVPSVPVRCITVDSPSHLYLAGEAGIPTHNTLTTLTLAYHAYLQGKTLVYVDPKSDSDDLATWIGTDAINYIDMTASEPGLLDPFVMTATLNSTDDPNLAFNAVVGVCTMLTGIQSERAHKDAIVSAVRAVIDAAEASRTQATMHTLTQHLLAQPDQISRSLGAQLSGFASDRYGRLLFSDGRAQLAAAADRFTIIVMNGLSLPEQGTPREEYQPEHCVAMAVFSSTMLFAQRLMMLDALSGKAGERVQRAKAVLMDEAWTLFATAEGRSAANSILRLGRSMNTAFTLVTQKVSDIPNANAYVSTHLAFNPGTDNADVDAVADALKLDIDQDIISSLPRGTCLMRDTSGRKARVAIDAWDRELFEAIDTTPGA